MTPREYGQRGRAVFLERIPYDPAAWDTIVAGYEDAEVYHTAAWLAFLAATQHAEPVVAIVYADHRAVGHFVGAIVRRYGIRILGSPVPGWTTQCMGFLLEEGFARRDAAEALLTFAFRDLGCLHVELSDRNLSVKEMAGSSFEQEVGITFRIDLTPSESAILAGMQSKTRQKIRKAIRGGLHAEVASDLAFADEFYAYLRSTFARQGLAPTYGAERVRNLIESVHAAGSLLLLRVRSPEGKPIAAGISVGYGRTAVSWGLAFDRDDDDLNPAQFLWWETIREWRTRGSSCFDMGGDGAYKAKYGGAPVETAHFHCSRWAVLRAGRSTVRESVRLTQIVRGRRTTHAAGSIPESAPTTTLALRGSSDAGARHVAPVAIEAS